MSKGQGQQVMEHNWFPLEFQLPDRKGTLQTAQKCYQLKILWKLLHDLHQVFFYKSSVCKTLRTGLVLPLLKGNSTKANNKDNYRGITLSLRFVKFMK